MIVCICVFWSSRTDSICCVDHSKAQKSWEGEKKVLGAGRLHFLIDVVVIVVVVFLFFS